MEPTSKAQILTQICQSIAAGRLQDAGAIAARDYPFVTRLPVGRNYDEATSTAVFVRDGFLDRYTGERLVFPGVLRVLSELLPESFPYHPNWVVAATHPAYWEVYPTIDHVVPVFRGGSDDETNWVTTSMLRNSSKNLWLVEELGWRVYPPGDVHVWDGLMNWFVQFVRADTRLRANDDLDRWYKAALHASP